MIINVHTDAAASLALASIAEASALPVLLINCSPTQSSRLHFEGLRDRWQFDIIEWPTRDHGAALDQLFAETADEALLLVDSDAELIAPA